MLIGLVAIAAIVGVGVGLLLGRRASTPLHFQLEQSERTLREQVVPVLEMRARELGVTFVPIPPPSLDAAPSALQASEATVRHLQNLSKGIIEKEHAVNMALSDTVQMNRNELASISATKPR